MTDSMSLPPAMSQRAREFTGPPVPARPAATVVLLRPHGDTFQVYVLRRATTMAFGGQYAFPGGVVDPSDAPARDGDRDGQPAAPDHPSQAATEQPRPDATNTAEQPPPNATNTAGQAPTNGMSAAEQAPTNCTSTTTDQPPPNGTAGPADHPVTVRTDWPERLGLPRWEAHAVVSAAARELFEETGVLLAGPRAEPDRIVAATDTPDWEADRAAVQARTLSMTGLLARHDLRLRDDLLLPWTRWITPEFEPRRYDTWFFVALLPETQSTRDVSGEASTTAWITPAETSLPMLPPTRRTLHEIAAHSTIPKVVAASAHRDAATARIPRIEIGPDGEVKLHLP